MSDIATSTSENPNALINHFWKCSDFISLVVIIHALSCVCAWALGFGHFSLLAIVNDSLVLITIFYFKNRKDLVQSRIHLQNIIASYCTVAFAVNGWYTSRFSKAPLNEPFSKVDLIAGFSVEQVWMIVGMSVIMFAFAMCHFGALHLIIVLMSASIALLVMPNATWGGGMDSNFFASFHALLGLLGIATGHIILHKVIFTNRKSNRNAPQHIGRLLFGVGGDRFVAQQFQHSLNVLRWFCVLSVSSFIFAGVMSKEWRHRCLLSAATGTFWLACTFWSGQTPFRLGVILVLTAPIGSIFTIGGDVFPFALSLHMATLWFIGGLIANYAMIPSVFRILSFVTYNLPMVFNRKNHLASKAFHVSTLAFLLGELLGIVLIHTLRLMFEHSYGERMRLEDQQKLTNLKLNSVMESAGDLIVQLKIEKEKVYRQMSSRSHVRYIDIGSIKMLGGGCPFFENGLCFDSNQALKLRQIFKDFIRNEAEQEMTFMLQQFGKDFEHKLSWCDREKGIATLVSRDISDRIAKQNLEIKNAKLQTERRKDAESIEFLAHQVKNRFLALKGNGFNKKVPCQFFNR